MTYQPSLAFTCPRCHRQVTLTDVHELLHIYPQDELHAVQHAIGECPACKAAVLLKNVASPGTTDHGWERWWGDATVLYPMSDEKLDPAIPQAIAASLQEAVRARQAGAPTAAAIMCRRTLEGVCAHFGFAEGSLYHKLKALKDGNHIDERIYGMADLVLRDRGNDAAHDVAQVFDDDDAAEALEFTRVVLHHVFVVESAYVAFRSRRPPKTGK